VSSCFDGRVEFTRRSFLAMAGASAALVAGCAPEASPEPGQDGAVRYSYGDHPSQYAELTLPTAAAPAPVVVVVHGGYWTARYGAELGRPLAADLAARGFAALNVEYRRAGDGGGWPQTGEDVAAAVDVLRERSAGLDLNRVVGLGHSAGGQLVGWLAARRDAAVAVTGAVLQAGVLDLVRGSELGLGDGAVDAFLGGAPRQVPQAYAEASPIALLPLGVPTVAVHGTSDGLVPIEQSRDFVAAAVAAGDRAEIQTFDGDHFDPITVGTAAWDLCVEALTRLT
jgi:acetyl esterase/lipase